MPHLGMGMALTLSPALELRQKLETTLNLSLTVRPAIVLSLDLYREREHFCTKLYKVAWKKGKVRRYQKHGLDFEYALVSKKDVPEIILQECGSAFSHCLMKGWDCFFGGTKYAKARGSWLLFVVDDMHEKMPGEVIEYGAVHERGEMITLGDHNLASKLEFAVAAEEKRLRWYMDWIERYEPVKFADVFNYQTHFTKPPEEELDDILQVFQSSEEANTIRRLMEEFDWPYSILQKLNQCRKVNQQVKVVINRTFLQAKDVANNAGVPLVELVQQIISVLTKNLQEIACHGTRQYVSPSQHSDYWRIERSELDKIFIESLQRRKTMVDQALIIDEIKEAKLKDSLPQNGVLSFDFSVVLSSL